MNLLIGLDIGTTGTKVLAFDEKGQVLGRAMREYAVDFPHPTWAEQDAEYVWFLAQESLLQLTKSLPVGSVVLAIGLSVQGEAVIPVDTDGNALRPAILGMDTRTKVQNNWLEEKIGARELFDHTGMPLHTVNTLPKMLWVKENEPDIWKKAARFLLYEDFIIQKLIGSPIISHCLASRTQMYDTRKRHWSPLVLSLIGLDEKRLSPIQESGYVCGRIKSDLAEKLGFQNMPLVVTGGHDQACGALGAGNVNPGQASVSTGTAEVIEVTMSTPVLNDALFQSNISIYSHVVPGRYVAMTLNHSGGILLRWFRDTFCQQEKLEANKLDGDAYDRLLEGATLGPSGMFVLPHFSGSGTPWFDTTSRGAILGLTLSTNKLDVLKAILEGLTYDLRVNTDLLRNNGIPINEIRAIGGGARSDYWLHLKANILQIPVLRVKVTDAACWGAAVLAGIGAGVFADAAEAASHSLALDKPIIPDPIRSKVFDEEYALYCQVYPAIKSINEKISARGTKL